MLKYYHEPDENIKFAIYSEDKHKVIFKLVSELLGYDFEVDDDPMCFVDDSVAFDRDTVIIYHNVFVENFLELANEDVGLYII